MTGATNSPASVCLFRFLDLASKREKRVPSHRDEWRRRPQSSDVVKRTWLRKRRDEVERLDEHHAEHERAGDEVSNVPTLQHHHRAKEPRDGPQRRSERHHQLEIHGKRQRPSFHDAPKAQQLGFVLIVDVCDEQDDGQKVGNDDGARIDRASSCRVPPQHEAAEKERDPPEREEANEAVLEGHPRENE